MTAMVTKMITVRQMEKLSPPMSNEPGIRPVDRIVLPANEAAHPVSRMIRPMA